ncbi:MAG: endolytic transglycosylase MltG [Armatimonadota bacterium]|nr:endolytic transglycosylase MltG [Armatimonadota bacterium]
MRRRVFYLLLVLAVSAWGIVIATSPIDPRGQPKSIVIPRNASTSQIGELLEREKLIRHRLFFTAAVGIMNRSGDLKAGEYRLSPAMSLWEIVARLVKGEALLHSVTIPEGFTASQIAALLEERGLAKRERFLALVFEPSRFPFSFLAGARSLEGYLFPDTYLLPRGVREEAIIQRMLQRFDEVVSQEMRERAKALGLSLHQIVTIASMIEREAKRPEERPLIAQVIYNRLKRGMRLEIDATVLYALGHHKERLDLRDLDVESPYNTYRHPGLPPGPIANPGLDSIRAALYPANADYLYYVAKPDGSHVFSRTYQEHLEAQRRIQRGR